MITNILIVVGCLLVFIFGYFIGWIERGKFEKEKRDEQMAVDNNWNMRA